MTLQRYSRHMYRYMYVGTHEYWGEGVLLYVAHYAGGEGDAHYHEAHDEERGVEHENVILCFRPIHLLGRQPFLS